MPIQQHCLALKLFLHFEDGLPAVQVQNFRTAEKFAHEYIGTRQGEVYYRPFSGMALESTFSQDAQVVHQRKKRVEFSGSIPFEVIITSASIE